jgi:hypothetical protein
MLTFGATYASGTDAVVLLAMGIKLSRTTSEKHTRSPGAKNVFVTGTAVKWGTEKLENIRGVIFVHMREFRPLTVGFAVRFSNASTTLSAIIPNIMENNDGIHILLLFLDIA